MKPTEGNPDEWGFESLDTVTDRRAILGMTASAMLAGCISLERFNNSDNGEFDAAGEIDLIIDGEPFDLTQDRFQAEYADDYSLAFHMHAHDERWYRHNAEPVTIGEGLDLLPDFSCEPTNGGIRLEINETVYNESDPGTEIVVVVNEEQVEAFEYVPQDGDAIRIEISTE